VSDGEGGHAASHELQDIAPTERREAILVAAARVISRQGVRGLRVEDVASQAGVSPPLLYYHFSSRSGLIRAALEHASERAPSTALRRHPVGPDGFEAVKAALLAELDEDPAVRDNAIVWGEVSASAVFEPALRDDVRRVTDEWRATVTAGIQQGCDDGSIRLDTSTQQAAEILITLVDGLCTRWLAGAVDLERARGLLSDAIHCVLGREARA
jgi:AcrR family transcriptional regulator